MKLDAHSYTNKGGRAKNEDSLNIVRREENGVFILADGLGGHQGGDLASQTAVRVLTEHLHALRKPDPERMRKAFLSANGAILDAQNEPGCKGMKSTAVALHLCGDQALWGHVGDSRLYCFSDRELAWVTKDQSVTYAKYLAGDIPYAQIRADEDRSSLLGALGNSARCAPKIADAPQTVKAGDAFLLCSDGFWEYVDDEEMLIDLLKSETAKEWADLMLLRHIARAKPNNDNFSLITLCIGWEELTQ